LRRVTPGADLLLHSDQGCQYTSYACQDRLAAPGIRANGRGNCWDSAVMERFFRSLKTESISRDRYQTREEIGWTVKKIHPFLQHPVPPFCRGRHVTRPNRARLSETGLTDCPNLLDHYNLALAGEGAQRLGCLDILEAVEAATQSLAVEGDHWGVADQICRVGAEMRGDLAGIEAL